MDAKRREFTEYLKKQHADSFGTDSDGTIVFFTMSTKALREVENCAKDCGFKMSVYLPIDKKNDKCGEFEFTQAPLQ